MAPSGTPMNSTTSWTTNATVMLTWAPSSKRLRMSRPSESVPSGWAMFWKGASGRLLFATTAVRSWTWYGQGASSGPKIPANSRRNTPNAPTIASLFLRSRPKASFQTPSLRRAVAATPGRERV